MRVPWTARRSIQSILKEINPEFSLEGLMLKLQYFDHLMRRDNSLEKTLMLGKTKDRRRKGQQRMRLLDSITDSMELEFEQTLGDGEGQGSLASCSPWGRKESDMTLATEQQHNLHITGNHFFSNIFRDFWHRFSLFLKPASILIRVFEASKQNTQKTVT